MLRASIVIRICKSEEYLFWKWKASSKNNALYYRVRNGSSSSKCIIFYLLIAMLWLVFAYCDVVIGFMMDW